MIRQFIADVRATVHRKAERLRIEAYGRREQLRAEGWPDDRVNRYGELDLAVANLLDALAGRRP